MYQLKKKREEILLQCENILHLGEEIISSEPHPIIGGIAEHIKGQVLQIKEICSVEQYCLLFNGRVGIGKSTAICMILDLLKKSKLKKGIRFDEVPALQTGSGRTTLCKTKILFQADESRIEIEPISLEEYEILLKELKMSLSKKDMNDKQSKDNDKQSEDSISSEEKSCLLTMAGLSTDFSVKVAPEGGVEELIEKIREKINYPNRQKTVYPCEGDFLEWLSDTYAGINSGGQPEAPIPSEIRLYINPKDFNAGIPPYISEIIDTRGLDGGERQDIQDSLKSSRHLSFFCDEINGYGSDDIIRLLKPALIKEDRFKKYRVQLLGIEKDEELSNITGAIEDREKAKKIKIRQAKDKMNDSGICFYDENYQFFSSLNGIEVHNKKILETDEDKMRASRQAFWDNIDKMLWNMYVDLQNSLNQYSQNMNFLSQGKITKEIENKIESCRMSFLEIAEQRKKQEVDIIPGLEKVIMDIKYASALRGSVNRNGCGNTNVYSQFYDCGGEQFEVEYRIPKTEMMTIISERLNGSDDMEVVCKENLLEKVEELYRLCFEKQQIQYKQMTEKIYNWEDWQTAKGFWGDKKRNYKGRVWGEIEKALTNRGVLEAISRMVMEREFLRKVLEFFKIS